MRSLQKTGGNPFQAIYQAGNGYFRRIIDQEVDIVPLSVHFNKNGVKRPADAAEDLPHILQMVLTEHEFPVFRDEDQMDM